jgi:hypothetical protein
MSPARRARKMASCGRQQGAINRPEFRPHDLPAQDLQLVAQHQQLNVLHMQAATATNKRAEQRPHSEVEKRESHAADPPSPRPTKRRHEYWRPSADRTWARRPLSQAESSDHRARPGTRTASGCGRAGAARAPGCGAITAAKLLAEIGPISRFTTRPPQRRRTTRSKLRQKPTAPTRPRRQPATQRRALPHRDHAITLLPRRPRLPRTQTSRRQKQARSDPLPQTPARPHRLQHTKSEPRLDIGATLAHPIVFCRVRRLRALFLTTAIAYSQNVRSRLAAALLSIGVACAAAGCGSSGAIHRDARTSITVSAAGFSGEGLFGSVTGRSDDGLCVGRAAP